MNDTGQRIGPALAVVCAGVGAALHVGKLPPAVSALQAALGIGLVQAGFLLSLVQLAGMSAGLLFGALADSLGGRRSMVTGLALLSLASAAGAFADVAAPLLALRAVEGFGFLLVVLPAPGLLRQLVSAHQLQRVIGMWGAYMPFGTALALLVGPVCIAHFGWRAWWWAMALLTAALAVVTWRAVPALRPAGAGEGLRRRLAQTLRAPGPWLVAMCFAAYSGQWLAVIGFLPAICTAAGLSGAVTGVASAAAAAVNMAGNIASGRLLHAGVAPTRLLVAGFVVMALAAAAAFAQVDGQALPPLARYAAVLAFSAVGGVIPATLFSLALRLAPTPAGVATSIGWVQQWSAAGQFAGPPLVAWLAARSGGWQWTWLATGCSSLAGLVLAAAIARALRRVG